MTETEAEYRDIEEFNRWRRDTPEGREHAARERVRLGAMRHCAACCGWAVPVAGKCAWCGEVLP